MLEEIIIACDKCPRLLNYISRIASVKTARYRDYEYWGRPLPGFGDPEAKLLIIGLAPAAHGGNRTGRMFTGDSSGEWLVKALYETGFSNKPVSVSRDDGLKLSAAYVTATVRCAPPANKPTREEIVNCSGYLAEELSILRDVKVILILGRIAFETYLRLASMDKARFTIKFKHGGLYRLMNATPLIISSYHPSRQNTQTGRLTWRMWIEVFRNVRRLLARG